MALSPISRRAGMPIALAIGRRGGTMVLLRRWRTRPDSRPRGPWAIALRVGLPLIASLGWGLGLLLVFPQAAYPLIPTMLIVPDLGYLVVASALAALTWTDGRPR